MPLCFQAAAEGAVPSGGKKSTGKPSGQKTAPVTERDLSITQTIPVPCTVIMGFITQPCTSLYIRAYLHPHADTASQVHILSGKERAVKKGNVTTRFIVIFKRKSMHQNKMY